MASNPTSKRGQVRACYEKDGEAAAAKLGAKLGIGKGRLRRWFRIFSGAATPAASEDGSAPTAPRPVIQRSRDPKDQVCLNGDPKLRGTYLERGPKESKVMWANGNIVVAPNKWLKPLHVETGA